MCGLGNDKEEKILSLWRMLAEDKARNPDKLNMACTHLTINHIWKEAKVQPLASLLNMIIHCRFEEESTLNTIQSAA